jgi:HlyD family type I secretion membrane fusion protein
MNELKRLVGSGLVIIIAGVLALGGWTVLAPLSGAIVAPAFVKVDLNRKVVQHAEGGIVREIHVRDGDRVKQGQVLVVLDDVKVDANLELLSIQLLAERAKSARLEAEAAYAPKLGFPADIVRKEREPRVAEILERERALFLSRRSSVESQVAALRSQIREAQSETTALLEQIAAEDRAISLQKEELKANEELLKQNFVQKTRVLTLQRAVAEYEVKHGEHRADLARSRQKASELELRIITAQNTYKQTAVDDLKDATAHIFDLEERLRPSRDAAQRQQVLAPIGGEIVGLKVFTAGAVVGPRDVLMEIVPAEKTLIVEARIRPEDINHVHVGDEAEVRLTAYKQRTTPLVAGRVSYVSGDRLVDAENKAAYYMAHIAISPASLGELRMQAGMPAEVYVRTDSRTVLDYLLAPVTAYLRRAMREPV